MGESIGVHLVFNWPWGSPYLHNNEQVKDQDEGYQEGPGDLVAGQKSPVQVVPADPVSADDQQNHRCQSDQDRPGGDRK